MWLNIYKEFVMCGNMYNLTDIGITEGYGNFTNMDRPECNALP